MKYLSFKEFIEVWIKKRSNFQCKNKRNPKHTQIKLNRDLHERC